MQNIYIEIIIICLKKLNKMVAGNQLLNKNTIQTKLFIPF